MKQNYRQFTSTTPMTNSELQGIAPAIFAEEAWGGMSSKYAFISTATLIDRLREAGFDPFSVRQSIARIEGKGDFAKHQLRFRQFGVAPIASLGGAVPEIIATNAHDGTGGYRIDCGLFRWVCFNGTFVGDMVGSIRKRHVGDVDDILDATFEVVDQFPRVIERAQEFHSIQMSGQEQVALAESALIVRYGGADDDHAPISAQRALTTHRNADAAPTLWNTFNVLQENLTQGGLRGYSSSGRRLRTKAVQGVNENTSLNKALWNLTERMAELMTGKAVAA